MTTLTINGNEVTIPEGMTMTVTPEGSMTFAPVSETPSKSGSKSRKSAPKGRKGGRKARLVRSTNLAEFGEAAGYTSLEGWTLEEFLLHLIAEGETSSPSWMPKGWAFGPASKRFLRSGGANW